MNNIRIFDKGIFINKYSRYIIEIGFSSFPIIDYNTYIIKNILNRQNRKKTNLEIINIIVIKDFYINIISETLLYKKRMWYYRFNKILRIRDKYKNIILL